MDKVHAAKAHAEAINGVFSGNGRTLAKNFSVEMKNKLIKNGSIEADNVTREMDVDGVHEKLKEKQQYVMHEMKHLNDMVADVFQQLKSSASLYQMNSRPKYDKHLQDKTKTSEHGLPEKQFVERNSVLTDLLKVKDLQTVYHIFVVIMLIMLMNTIISDILETGTTTVAINTIVAGFGKLSSVFRIWSVMLISTFLVYVGFSIWSQYRQELLPNSFTLKLWDYGWLVAFLSYLTLFFILPTKALLDEQLPEASSFIILMEKVRMLMKVYAFVRSVAPRFLNFKPHSDQVNPKCPEFSHYMYFLFAPTLLYRDSYPRTKEIRWKVAIWHFIEVIIVIFYVAFIVERYIYSNFKDFGLNPMGLQTIVVHMFNSCFSGMLFFLCGFYCLLHAWMNGCAELLRFADRLFYKDWWNSTSFGAYYRSWNVVVHDWLYTYIYKDLYEIVLPGRKDLAMLTVFITSAVVHEYILAIGLRFFCPILMFFFLALGLPLQFTVRRGVRTSGNVLLWFCLCIGNGVIFCVFGMEYFARKNCPPYSDDFRDYIVPRIWVCYQ